MNRQNIIYDIIREELEDKSYGIGCTSVFTEGDTTIVEYQKKKYYLIYNSINGWSVIDIGRGNFPSEIYSLIMRLKGYNFAN
jgi:hypothetical protein